MLQVNTKPHFLQKQLVQLAQIKASIPYLWPYLSYNENCQNGNMGLSKD